MAPARLYGHRRGPSPAPTSLLLPSSAPWYDPRARPWFPPAGRVQGPPLTLPLHQTTHQSAQQLRVRRLTRAPQNASWMVVMTVNARRSRSPLEEVDQVDSLYGSWGERGISAASRCEDVRVREAGKEGVSGARGRGTQRGWALGAV